MSELIISRMSRQELDGAVERAAIEGWNPGLRDADAFYAVDSQGFFSGKIDGVTVGHGSALVYDDAFAFCGFFIVEEKQRGKGHGMAITRARLEYVGNRNAGIDGVVAMVDKYKNIGYRTAHRNVRYGGTGKAFGRADPHIVPIDQLDFGELSAYDRRHFPARRDSFLRLWIDQPEGASLAYVVNGEIKGYGVLRACRAGFKIGPLFAENRNIADALYQAFSTRAEGADIFLDTPEPNREAVALAESYGMKPVFETSRMYLKGDPGLPLANIFGITSFEAG
jgi:GNAT superfamily N-acetyltransferase